MANQKEPPSQLTANVSSVTYGRANPSGPPASRPFPDDPRQALAEAQRYIQAGCAREALDLCRHVLAARPDHPAALHMGGLLALQVGEPGEAVDLLARTTKIDPDNPAIHLQLGAAQGAQGQLEAALASFRRAIGLKPDLADGHYNLGLTLHRQGCFREACEAFREAARLQPDSAPIHDGLGRSLRETGALDEALGELRLACELDPSAAAFHNNLGNLRTRIGDHHGAVASLRRAAELAPGLAEISNNLGNALFRLHQADEALEAFRKAVRLAPENAAFHANLAYALDGHNLPDEAGKAAATALSLDPDQPRAQLVQARLGVRHGNLEQARQDLLRLRRNGPPDDIVADAARDLGEVLDRLGLYDAAFKAFLDCNAHQAARPLAARFDREDYPGLVERNRSLFDGEMVSRWSRVAPEGFPAPVFLVGFPRSGTTLMERVIGAHPRFVTSDEQPWLERTIAAIGGGDPDTLDRLTADDIADLRAVYRAAAEDTLGGVVGDGKLFDKTPLNLVHLGAVRRLFPDAKVLVALRDPRDAVLSCLMQNFRLNTAMVHFLELPSAARLYAAVMDLWLHYRSILGLEYLEYRYEDVVESLEDKVRQIIAFLGEEWDQRVLDYAETASGAYISTPSRRDVGGTIHRRGVGRWRNYRHHLEPVLPVLAPFVEAFGYD